MPMYQVDITDEFGDMHTFVVTSSNSSQAEFDAAYEFHGQRGYENTGTRSFNVTERSSN